MYKRIMLISIKCYVFVAVRYMYNVISIKGYV